MTSRRVPTSRRDRTVRRLGSIALPLSIILAGCNSASSPTAVSGSGPTTTPSPVTGTDSSLSVESSSAPTTSTVSSPPTTSAPLADPTILLEPIGQFEQPVDLAHRVDDDTLFVVERIGRVIPVRSGRVGDPVLDLRDRTKAEGERGLLGLTFSLDGTLAYVNHTDLDGNTVIAEYAVDEDGRFAPSTRRVLLEIDQPYANHNGGSIAIGPDGMLWIGMGDGGSGGDPERRALDLSTPHGKILRIDPTPVGDRPYRIPADNPYASGEGALPEIWSIGVRNPWRMSFDRATGDLWFGDVGEREVEEINVAWASDGTGQGANWGWSAFEGTRRFNVDQPAEGTVAPLYEYDHSVGCSVTGGEVYRGVAIPSLVGWYVFGDFCSGALTALRVDGRRFDRVVPLDTLEALTAIRSGPDGELYALSLDGSVVLVQPTD